MTPGDAEALVAIDRRLEHVTSTVSLLAAHHSADEDMSAALYGIAHVLREQRDKLGALTN